jgi:hypothetical protein
VNYRITEVSDLGIVALLATTGIFWRKCKRELFHVSTEGAKPPTSIASVIEADPRTN